MGLTLADRHAGRRLRERRVQLGLSLAQLSAGIGVTTQQARKYEAGCNAIPAARLAVIAQVLGVPVGWFFDGLDGEYVPVLPTRPRMLLDLVRAGERLPDEGLAALCEASAAFAGHLPAGPGGHVCPPAGVRGQRPRATPPTPCPSSS